MTTKTRIIMIDNIADLKEGDTVRALQAAPGGFEVIIEGKVRFVEFVGFIVGNYLITTDVTTVSDIYEKPVSFISATRAVTMPTLPTKRGTVIAISADKAGSYTTPRLAVLGNDMVWKELDNIFPSYILPGDIVSWSNVDLVVKDETFTI